MQLRQSVPVLGILALAVLFLKLPETPDIFGIVGCKTCATSDPYLPLLASGYFAALVGIALLFPSFPGRQIAKGGLVWAFVLAVALTWMNLPGWCLACLIAHALNLAIWTIWVLVPPEPVKSRLSTLKERLCLAVFAPVSVVALFSCLNLTFMAYGYRINPSNLATTSLRSGDPVPAFSAQTHNGRSISNDQLSQLSGTVLNFISPECHYCKEQLPIIDSVAGQLAGGAYRFINISPELSPQLLQHSPGTEWIEDGASTLRRLFQVSGYPTLFLVGPDGKIQQIIPGVPGELHAMLLGSLVDR